jgi:hypothetical protein
MATSQTSSRIAGGCLVLFSLPFTAMGTFFAVLSYRSLHNPAFKNPQIGIIFGSGFALIGLFLMFSGFAATRKLNALRAIEQSYPDQPWMWRPDWAQGRADGLGGRSASGAWLFAVIWNGVSWGGAYALSQNPDPRRPIWAGLAVGLFCAIGVGALLIALVQTIRFARFGNPSLALQTIPAPLGRKLKGTIDARLPNPLPHGINLCLTCVNRVTSGTGNSRSTTDHICWQEKKTLGPEQIMAGPSGSTIPVEFDVPRDMQPTDHQHYDNQLLWLLRAEADIPGVNFDEKYEVPVFETRESPRLEDWRQHQESEERSHPATAPTRPTVQVSSALEGGTQFYFPAGRNVSVALWLTVFTGIFGSASYALFHLHAPVFFAVIFSFFSALLLLITLNLWFGTGKIIVNSNGVKFSTNLLGFGGSKQWTPQQIQRIYPKITMQSGDVAYYTVTLADSNGRNAQLGNALRDHNEAEWVCEQIRNLVGLNAKSTAAS